MPLPIPRRRILGLGGVMAVEAALGRHSHALEPAMQTSQSTRVDLSSVKALVFDVFGTVVDWRTSVAREVEALATRKRIKVDGPAFADAWRSRYAPAMDRVRTGALPWTPLDRLHRLMLEEILPAFGLAGLSEDERANLNRAWHRLQPWPDSVPGLTRLKKKFIIAPLSNGNVALMTNMAKHAALPWDAILGAELVRHYKPDREVYQSAADFLMLEPREVMMVAAHLGDLQAARAGGLRTAFVTRPLEYGPNVTPDLQADASVEIAVKDFIDLATSLGA